MVPKNFQNQSQKYLVPKKVSEPVSKKSATKKVSESVWKKFATKKVSESVSKKIDTGKSLGNICSRSRNFLVSRLSHLTNLLYPFLIYTSPFLVRILVSVWYRKKPRNRSRRIFGTKSDFWVSPHTVHCTRGVWRLKAGHER